jgi:hypothetical protein
MVTSILAVNGSSLAFAEEEIDVHDCDCAIAYGEGGTRYGMGSCPWGCGFQGAIFTCNGYNSENGGVCQYFPCLINNVYNNTMVSCSGCKKSGNYGTHQESIHHSFCGIGFVKKCNY